MFTSLQKIVLLFFVTTLKDPTVCKKRFWKFSEKGLQQAADDIKVSPFLQRSKKDEGVIISTVLTV